MHDFFFFNLLTKPSDNKGIKYLRLKATYLSFTSWPHPLTLFLLLSLITSEKKLSSLFRLRIQGHPETKQKIWQLTTWGDNFLAGQESWSRKKKPSQPTSQPRTRKAKHNSFVRVWRNHLQTGSCRRCAGWECVLLTSPRGKVLSSPSALSVSISAGRGQVATNAELSKVLLIFWLISFTITICLAQGVSSSQMRPNQRKKYLSQHGIRQIWALRK